MKASADGDDQWSVWVRRKEEFEMINIYWGNDLKEVGILSDGSQGYGVGKFICRRRREW